LIVVRRYRLFHYVVDCGEDFMLRGSSSNDLD